MRERQDITRKAISANAAAKAVPASVLACVVLLSGALFGMAAQTALDHHGLDLSSVRDHLIVDQVAGSRSALAWWAWWFVAVAAFFVGPLSAAATRCLVANWWLLRGVRLLVSAAVVLGLAGIGHLPAAPSAFDVRAGAGAGAAVALLSAALAAIGARSVRAARRRRGRLPALDDGRRGFDPVAAPPPRRGGGSVDSGFVVRRFRPGHALVPGFRGVGRLALAGAAALVVLAAVSALSGAAVVLEFAAPGAIRQLLARTPPPAVDRLVHTVPAQETQARATQTRAMAFAPLLSGEAARPHIAIVATIPESELTFARGYAKRRAAREAAEIVATALQFQIKVPDKLRSRAVTLQRTEHGSRPHRPVASDRARDGHHGARRYAVAHDPGGAHRRYVAYDGSPKPRTADNCDRSRHGDHDRYGYARYDDFRFAGF